MFGGIITLQPSSDYSLSISIIAQLSTWGPMMILKAEKCATESPCSKNSCTNNWKCTAEQIKIYNFRYTN